jgi:hypothetical protein
MYGHRFNNALTIPVLNHLTLSIVRAAWRECEMGTVIDFSAEAATRRLDTTRDVARCGDMGTVLILPVIRIERDADATNDGRGPEEGAAPGRRRRRRARS